GASKAGQRLKWWRLWRERLPGGREGAAPERCRPWRKWPAAAVARVLVHGSAHPQRAPRPLQCVVMAGLGGAAAATPRRLGGSACSGWAMGDRGLRDRRPRAESDCRSIAAPAGAPAERPRRRHCRLMYHPLYLQPRQLLPAKAPAAPEAAAKQRWMDYSRWQGTAASLPVRLD